MVVSAARGSIALIKKWKRVRDTKLRNFKEVREWEKNKALFNPKKYPGARGTPKHTWETSELGQMVTRARKQPTTGNILALHAKLLEKQQQRRRKLKAVVAAGGAAFGLGIGASVKRKRR
jgi:hypothetical protein